MWVKTMIYSVGKFINFVLSYEIIIWEQFNKMKARMYEDKRETNRIQVIISPQFV